MFFEKFMISAYETVMTIIQISIYPLYFGYLYLLSSIKIVSFEKI